MRMTTKSEYALRAIFDISNALKNSSVVRIEDIAKRQDIPVYYLEQILNKLRHAGIVASLKGPGGGYHLFKSINEIRLKDVFEAVGDNPIGRPKATKTATRASIKVDKILKVSHKAILDILEKTLGDF